MSYQGYVQVLCKNGHYRKFDAYNDPTDFFEWENKKPWTCPDCGEKMVWSNNVDQTNGEDFGYVELEIEHDAEEEECRSCGHVEVTEPVRFKIPEKSNED
jgi:predicted RNA-binding Zn-ribbon protein involved in translation (DUF1610 family)